MLLQHGTECIESNKNPFLCCYFRLAKVQENTIASLRNAASHVCTLICTHIVPVHLKLPWFLCLISMIQYNEW